MRRPEEESRSRIRSTVCFSLRVTLQCVILAFLCSTKPSLQTSLEPGEVGAKFVEKCKVDCATQRTPFVCGKYRVARWLHNVMGTKEFKLGPFRLIRVHLAQEYSDFALPKLQRSHIASSDIAEALGFARDIAEDMLTSRALVYTFERPTGARGSPSFPMILDEEELEELRSSDSAIADQRLFHKKKKSLILPLLVLLKLISLKLWLVPIFFGVHFVKKVILLGALLFSNIYKHLKICKAAPQGHFQHQQTYPYHVWTTAAEAPVDYPSGSDYGHDDAGWMHRNDLQSHQGYQGYQGYPGGAYRAPYTGYYQGAG